MATTIASWLWRPFIPRQNATFRIRIRIPQQGVSTRNLIDRRWTICRASTDNQEDVHDDKEERTNVDPAPQVSEEPPKVISGSPLPGVKAPFESVKIPKDVLETIRNQVFSFDTFFATGQEYYEAGVVFRGNLRGEPSASHAKISRRLQDKFGDEYRLFFILDPEENKPLAAVVKDVSLQTEPGAVPDWVAVAAFGLVTVATVFIRNSPGLQLSFLTGRFDIRQILEAVPGVLGTGSVLAVHELGHYLAAKRTGVALGLPYFIPSWQLGSFGAITRITSVLKDRSELLQIAASGPLAGALFSLTVIVIGLLLTPGQGQGLFVNSTVFHDSLLVGGLAKVILGDSLKENSTLYVNPFVLYAWSGLLINAINCIPIGELDGGRIAEALWGRKVWSRLTGVSIGLLGVCGIFSDVALYWVVLAVFLQRGPIPPQGNEITAPNSKEVLAGVSVLFLSLLVCCPFPFSFS